jgi:hypothetical protein
MAYHPPIFTVNLGVESDPCLSCWVRSTWDLCMCPHTTLDSVLGGVDDSPADGVLGWGGGSGDLACLRSTVVHGHVNDFTSQVRKQVSSSTQLASLHCMAISRPYGVSSSRGTRLQNSPENVTSSNVT